MVSINIPDTVFGYSVGFAETFLIQEKTLNREIIQEYGLKKDGVQLGILSIIAIYEEDSTEEHINNVITEEFEILFNNLN